MFAGGDIPSGRPGNISHGVGNSDVWPSAGLENFPVSKTTADVVDRYLRDGPPKIRPFNPFHTIGGYFGNIIKRFFPEFFGIFGRVHKFIPDYRDFIFLEAASGAQFFYIIVEDEILLAGNLYDIASFIHKLMDEPEAWSMGSVVSALRDGDRGFASVRQGLSFGRPVYNHDTQMIEVFMRPARDGATSVADMRERFKEVSDLFGTMDEYEIEESVAGEMRYADVIAALNRAFRGVRPRHSSDVEMMITMKPPDAVFGAGLRVDRLDVGMRLAIDGKISALTFRMLESGNEALWIGRTSARSRTIFWDVEDLYPDDVDKARRAVILGQIALVFKPDVTHLLAGSGGGKGSGTPFTPASPPPQSTPPPAPETPPVNVSGLMGTAEAVAVRTYAGGVRHGINTQLLSARTFMPAARALPFHIVSPMSFTNTI